MKPFYLFTFSWMGAELFLTVLVFVLYTLLKKINSSPSDRFQFLRLSLFTLLFIPFITFPSFSMSSWESSVPFAEPLASSQTLLTLEKTSSNHSILTALLVLYLVLVTFNLFRLFVSLLKVELIAREGEKVLTHRGFPVIVHSLSMPPATVGVFHPRILIPRKIYEEITPAQLSMILRHEEIHIERKDYFSNLVVGLVQALLGFSPFIYFIGKSFRAEMELSVDAKLLKEEKCKAKDYGHLLLDLLTRVPTRPDLAYSGLFVSNSLITRRINAMKNINPKTHSLTTFGFFLLFALAGAYGTKALGLQNYNSIVSPVWDAGKDLKLGVSIDLDTVTGVGEVKSKVQIALNYEETGSISLGGKKVDLKPTKFSGSPQMEVTVYDEKGTAIHHSALPFNGEATVSAKLDPAVTGIHTVGIYIVQL